jgi:hypothetical protein
MYTCVFGRQCRPVRAIKSGGHEGINLKCQIIVLLAAIPTADMAMMCFGEGDPGFRVSASPAHSD